MITTMYITARDRRDVHRRGGPAAVQAGERSDQRIGQDRIICTIAVPRVGVEHCEQHADEDKIRDRNGDIDHQLLDEAEDRGSGIRGDATDQQLQDLRDELNDHDREDRREVDAAEVGRMRRKGARIGSTMIRSQRTTGCHGLSPIQDTAIRAMISTVNAPAMKPMTLTRDD